MPTFELEAPDGQVYEIEAQDEISALKAVEHAFGGQQQGAASEPPADPFDTGGAVDNPALKAGLERKAGEMVRAEYDQLPWYKQAGQAADDIVRLGVDGLTSGFADKAIGAIGGDTEGERLKTENARQRAGLAGTAAEIGGSVYGAGKLLQGGGALVRGAGAVSPTVARVAGGAANLAAKPGVVGLGARTAGAAATGAGLGALNAAGHDQDVGEGAAYGAVFGAGGNLVGEGVAKVAGKAAGMFNKKPKIMTREEIKAASNAAYKAADDAGVIVKPQAVQRLAQEIKSDLADFGYRPALQPKVSTFLDDLDVTAQDNVTLKGLDGLRQVAGLLGKSENGAEREIARQIIKKIDKHLEGLKANDILTGNKTEGVRALQEARKLWASQKKSEMIEQAIERAKNQAASTYSGGNIDNALRQQFRRILDDPKKSRGLTPDERAVLTLIVRGKTGEGLLRTVAKLSPNGSGLMAMLGIGSGAAFGPAGLLAPAAGMGAKAVADRLTPARVEQLSRVVRAGGSEAATRAAPNATQRFIERYKGDLPLPLTVGGILATD